MRTIPDNQVEVIQNYVTEILIILSLTHSAPEDVKSLLQKKYAAFLPRKWLKTAYFCIEDLILLLQNGGGYYVSATSFIKKQKYLQHFLILQVFEKTFLSILSYLQKFLHLYLLSDASQHV